MDEQNNNLEAAQTAEKCEKKSPITLICAIAALVLAVVALVVSIIGGGNGEGSVTAPTVAISDDGYWIINGEKTSVKAEGKDGADGENGGNSTSPVDENPLGLDFYLKDDGTYAVSSGAAKYLSEIEIPATYKGKPVTEIAAQGFSPSFANSANLTSITIPDSVTTIGSSAFNNCSSLTSVTIGDSVTSISSSAFSGCPIESATIPTIAISYIPKGKLKTVVITSGDTIGGVAFSGCSSLTSVTIPDSVTTIGDDAFYNCSSLTSVHINDIAKWCEISFADYDSNPLCYAKSLYLNGELVTELTIPDSVTEVGYMAFSGCTSLTSVTILDSVTEVGERAFYDCDSLTSVTIGDSVTSIGSSAFRYCLSLTSVTIPDSVTTIGWGAFSGCSSLTSVTIPDRVTTIGNYAFEYCSSLTSITIPDSVTTIGSSTFSGCSSLTSVTIPDSVTEIGRVAFSGCSSLTSINYNGTKAQWNAISKSYDWNQNTGRYTIYCTDGNITKY